MNVRLLHPLIQSGLHKGDSNHAGGILACKCTDRPVKVKVSAGIAHNHGCGCTKCWKPDGAAFSVVAVVPSESVAIVEVVEPSALIQRHACKECGTHMYGPVERDHAFKGLSFIHPELFDNGKWPAPGFAPFVSSVIEGGVDPSEMDGLRKELKGVGLEPYDCLSPALMDYLATWTAKKNGIMQ
ncbi:MAG: S-(hydroxymethyl)glutathione synthase [Mesorhizobium sp.]|uniref:S-(hydroxymethyl)glutathione synthase n=1 Tax=unclassified Mesorhizobium TaxID=325217 RepID=UPI000FE92FC9|nr:MULTISPECIES: S-(hydroxymethyl)glutathione synthase [unclassified Mesorhizobium]RWC21900.1 MAG: S-(hydroxymethyl)glutathione synthase [Mesorhizobium sp.]RWD75778.1 MAG: S-(hydroxymethyl)glutathione synthase [Mesorhizobium sp.]RWE52050.1 MAG: S-(hydroxymethyl)glutathione synthase [Mesorhizobium sp.]RWE92269.1 MAG: S-(hydroxymethyl)glutathione synthase [Mesorhizobium sp.]RWF51292.1 MAG: S-(hydroxymethyl)glutathione synthase [Mesorhizobium sp.]